MQEMIELNGVEMDMVAGGAPVVGSISVQNNIAVSPQVAVGVAVLSPGSNVNAINRANIAQVNVAFHL